MNLPATLHYTKDHEWIRVEGDVAYVGITDHAQKELGDAPETVNSDPYGNGWMVKISIANPEELADLLSAETYGELVGA